MSRLLFGYLMDRSTNTRLLLCGMAIFLEGALLVSIQLFDTYIWLIVYSAIFGLLAGSIVIS